MALKLCAVRHGETEWNTVRRLQGHIDIPLNAVGRRQAAAAAARLSEQPFAACYSSDLSRALETASLLTSGLSVSPTPTVALRERHYGCFQGLTYAEAAARYPDLYQKHLLHQAEFALPQGGESMAALHDRIQQLLRDLVARHQGEQVLLVTHGGVLDVIHRIVTDSPLDTARRCVIPNAALNWLRFDGNWTIDCWGDQSHLNGALDELP